MSSCAVLARTGLAKLIRLTGTQIREQVDLPRQLDLLRAYAGHGMTSVRVVSQSNAV